MWFAKWFGGRKAIEGEDEPARYAAPAVARPAPTVTSPALRPNGSRPRPAQKGFDPYNSGAFERRNAWERIKRR